MNPSFHIQAPQIDTTTAHLVVEAGPMGISFVILDDNNCFVAVVVYTFPPDMNATDIADKVEEIIGQERLLQQPYKKKDIIWTFPQSILVPHALMDKAANPAMLNLIYGDLGDGNIQTDFLFKHNLHNIYRIPPEVSNSFARHFPFASQTHQYSLLPDQVIKIGNQLSAIFYNNCFTLVLFRDGALQVIRNFKFLHPADAAYHLLNVCENFEVNVADIELHLSGMIETGSNLYLELHKYFLHIQFDQLPENVKYIEEIKALPSHYFSHLFALAACV